MLVVLMMIANGYPHPPLPHHLCVYIYVFISLFFYLYENKMMICDLFDICYMIYIYISAKVLILTHVYVYMYLYGFILKYIHVCAY